MKKKLLLEAVLKIKDSVERSISFSYDDIIKYNTTDKKVDNLLSRLERLEVQLLHLKEVIQEANKGKLRGITNNYNIYYLSNLTAKKRFYEDLISNLGKNKKAVNVQIPKEDAILSLNKLKEEIFKFQQKLTTFNSKKKVTVILDESLNLL